MYFYMPDQINSTRIVTDDTGTVVYSAAHDPYGGMQKTWVNTYDPTPKFSGKEQDLESQLDYFGARYYDKEQYRFISVDPVISIGSALYNAQRGNLYTYCGNNPINYIDFDGAQAVKVNIYLTFTLERTSYSEICTRGRLNLGPLFLGYTLELPDLNNIKNESCVNTDTYNLEYHLYTNTGTIVPKLEDKNERDNVLIHWFQWIYNWQGTKLTKGCISLGHAVNSIGHILDPAVDDMVNLMHGIERTADWLENWVGNMFGVWFDFEVMFRLNISDAPPGKVSYTHKITGYVF